MSLKDEKKSQGPQALPLEIEKVLVDLKRKNKIVRTLPGDQKKAFLMAVAEGLVLEKEILLQHNKADLESLSSEENSAFRDRLTLTEKRIEQMAESLRQVAQLPDPVGQILGTRVLANGLKLEKVTSPLGVILMIFESRPNVILEAFSMAFKSGNSIILRGGRESAKTAKALYNLIQRTAKTFSLPPEIFYGIENYDRAIVAELLRRKDLIDIVIPRGGDRLIEFVQENARMPIIKNDRGMCHAYVDESAKLEMALSIVVNGKTQRPGVCNSLETMLIHHSQAKTILPRIFEATKASSVHWYCDEDSFNILSESFPMEGARFELASPQAWDTEYLDQKLNCKVVQSLEEALIHIEKHSSRHSEVIITENQERAERFLQEVDSAAVYWNASTRFTDGFEFGLGGEIGISTQKLHVRGPVGLNELTSARWIIRGHGQVRN